MTRRSLFQTLAAVFAGFRFAPKLADLAPPTHGWTYANGGAVAPLDIETLTAALADFEAMRREPVKVLRSVPDGWIASGDDGRVIVPGDTFTRLRMSRGFVSGVGVFGRDA